MTRRIAAARRLLRWSRQGRALRPVFIVGEMRSGTSILYRVLLRHPTFAPRHFHLTEPHAVHALATQPGLDEAPFFMRAFFHGDEQRYESLVAAVRSVAPLRAPVLRLARRHPGSVGLFRLALTGVAVRAYVAAATEARGCRRLVDKTPSNLPYARHLLATVPDARLLYIVRHPVDTFGSYWRRYRRDPEVEWAAVSVEDFTSRWAGKVTTALDLAAAQPHSFRIVRYERFTADPAATLAEICAFLGEPYDPAALEPGKDRPARPIEPHLSGDIAPVTHEWREHVSVADAAAVEDRLGVPMRALGYERHTVAERVAD